MQTPGIKDPNLEEPALRSPFWWLRWVPTVVISILILYFLYVVGSVAIVPVLASFAVAYLLNPIVLQFEKRGISRPISSVVAILLVTLVVIAFLAYVLPDLWSESRKASEQIADSFTPENAARQREFLRRFSPALERVAGERIEKFLSDPVTVISNATTATTTVGDGTEVTTAGSTSLIISTISSSLELMLVPFFVFYILIDFQKWRGSLEDLIPPRFREPFSRLFDESGRILESYVRGQLLIGIIMAGCYAVGFWLLGVPAWAGIALIAGLLNSIPYVGTILGVTLASAFTLAEGGNWWAVSAVIGIFVLVQTLEGYVLTPRILGGRLNLHPMAVFLGLLIGGKLFGILGVILAIPAIAIGKVFLKFLRELYQATYFYHAGDIHASQAPPAKIEERIAEAAETVLAEQIGKDIEESEISTSEIPSIIENPLESGNKTS